MTAFTTEVEKHFGFLRSVGYDVLAIEPGSMSSGLAIFRGAHLSIQVLQDRGDWTFEAGALGDLRYADFLLAEVLPEPEHAGSTAVNHRDPAAVAAQLQQMLPAIEAAFVPGHAAQTIAALRRLVDARWESHLAEIRAAKRAT